MKQLNKLKVLRSLSEPNTANKNKIMLGAFMTNELLQLAKDEGVAVEFYTFSPPINGIYFVDDDLPPAIGLSKRLKINIPLLRCVLAEELGHHFTTVGDIIPKTYFSQQDRFIVSKAEYKDLRWAAIYLIPFKEFHKAFDNGIIEIWELAEHFTVTEEMIKFRFELLLSSNC